MRFNIIKDPVPANSWGTLINGSKEAPTCLQYNLFAPGFVFGQEDCLYLNIYTPQVKCIIKIR